MKLLRLFFVFLACATGLRAYYDVSVTGSTTGAVWGTDIYTADSNVGTAAVHAGLIASGQTATIRVFVVSRQMSFNGSTRNGVTSGNHGIDGSGITLSLVPAAGPVAPSVLVNVPATVIAGQYFWATAVGTDSNSDLNNLVLNWNGVGVVGSQTATGDSSTLESHLMAPSSTGTFQLRGEVSDNAGNFRTSAWYTVTVVAAGTNLAPTAWLSGPSTLVAGASATWTYETVDSNSNLKYWKLSVGPTILAQANISGGNQTSSYSCAFQPAGPYTLNLYSEDTDGASTTATMNITVVSPPVNYIDYGNLGGVSCYPDNSSMHPWARPGLAYSYANLNNGSHADDRGYGSVAGPNWLRADFGSAKKVLRLYTGGGHIAGWGTGAGTTNGTVLQYSSDNTNWTTAYTYASGFALGGTSIDVGTPGTGITARYWRISRSDWMATTEFRFEGEQTPHILTVQNGEGSATGVSENTPRPILANAPPASNYLFSHWVKISGAGSISDPNSPSTNFIMETSDAVVSAIYVPNQVPIAEITPSSTTLSLNQQGTWNYSATDANNNLSQWRVSLLPGSSGWQSISGGSQSAQFNYTFAIPGTYTFRLEVADTFGTTTRDAVVAVQGPPTITSQPQNQTVAAGGAVTLTVVAAALPSPTYQWKKGGVAVLGATGASLILNNLQTGDAGSYTVVIANNLGSVTSDAAILIVNNDSDGDGMANAWETQYGLNPNSAADALLDPDGDGLSNVAEYNLGKNPTMADASSATVGGTLDGAWPAANLPGNYVGFTPGFAEVNLGGAATYRVPIKVTPGSVGLQPSLQLQYSSQGGDGYLGQGWQLGGLPMITRGPATAAVDGTAVGMRFSSTDKFYLDGARLIAIASSYGADSAEYRTEIDTFSRVVSYGSAGNGPAYFKVWTKSGQVLEFGNTADSPNARLSPGGHSEALIWAVNRISDLSGNSIKVEYDADQTNGELLPAKIYYTCNSAAPTGYATIDFGYKLRTDPQSGFAFDAKTTTSKLLDKITVKSGTSVFRQYRLTYDDGITAYPSRLASIQEAAEDLPANAKVYPPTVFDYFAPPEEGLDGTSTVQTIAGAGAWSIAADLDGDGLTDLVRVDNRNAAWVEFHRNNGSSFSKVSEQLMVGGSDFHGDSFLTTDMDGDGRAEVILNPESPDDVAQGIVRQIKWNPSQGVLSPFTDIAVQGYQAMTQSETCYSADFTGDGRDDLLLVQFDRVQLLASTGTSYVASNFTNVSDLKNGLIEIGDFTGDGVADILNVVDELNDRRIRVFSVSTTAVTLVGETLLGQKRPDWRTMIADVNGDGQMDLLYSYKDTNGSDPNANHVEVWTRRGNTFEKTADQSVGGWNATQFRYIPFDYNGDRRTDLAILYKPAGNTTNVVVWKATGPTDAPFTAVDLGAIYNGWFSPGPGGHNQAFAFSPAQLNRDGLGDLLFVGFTPGATVSTPTAQNTKVLRLLSKPSASPEVGAFPNLLSTVTNGFGAKTTFSYLSLLAEGIYTQGTGSVYPDADVRPPFRVVSTVTEDRPGGTTAQFVYSYAGLKVNALRGLRGFETIKRLDSLTSLETTTTYLQAFPLTNLPNYVEVRNLASPSLALIRRTEYAPKSPVDSTSYPYGAESRVVYRPFVETTYTTEYDLVGIPTRSTFQKATQDGFGNTLTSYERFAEGARFKANLIEGSELVATDFERKLTATFDNDTAGANWLIARPTRLETYAKGGQYPAEAGTRVSALQYYPGTNRVRYSIQEPDAGQEAYRLQTEYVYDAFGNVASTTVSSPAGGDSGIAARTSSIDYSTSVDQPIAGRFPRQIVDALQQKVTLVHDPVTGLLTRKTDDATGLVTSFAQDAFGMPTLETRPDGTTTTTIYRWDSAAVTVQGAPTVAAKYHVDIRSSGAPPALARYEALGLPLQSMSVAGDGASLFSESLHDARGNMAAESRPHKAGATVYWTSTSYDRLNRPLTRDLPAPPPTANPTQVVFDHLTWAYSGRSVTTTNARGFETKQTSNALGSVTSIVNNPTFGINAPDRATLTFTYDGFGNVRESIDAAGNIVETHYDRLGRKIQVEDPNMGQWTYDYYVNGLLRRQTDAKLAVTTFAYDVLGRMKDRTVGSRVVHWDYNIASTTALPGAGAPQQVTVTEAAVQTFAQSWSYDSLSRVDGTTRAFGGKSYLFGQSYDEFGRLKVTTYPTADGASFATIHVYNGLGILKEIRRYNSSYSNGLGQVYWSAQSYEDDGQLRLAYLGNGAAVDRLHFAQNGRPAGDAVSINPPPPAALLPHLTQSYNWDGAGNLVSRGVAFTDGAAAPVSYVETFDYDAMNRVTGVIPSGTAGIARSYAYNQIGNLVTKDGQTFDYARVDPAEPVGPNAVRSALGASYHYDANGNVRDNTAGLTVTWRPFNQPFRITRGSAWAEFSYGAGDERILQTTQDGTQVRSVGSLYEVTVPQGAAANTEVRAYVMTPMGRTAVVKFNASGTQVSTRYLAQDQIGSTSLVLDEAGRMTERFSYDPWGAPRDASTTVNGAWPARQATTRGFTDHEMLSGVQLVHMNGRVYDPALGRFLSPDPMVNDADGTQAYNRYCYVRNNPLSFTDPSGYTGDGVLRLDPIIVRPYLVDLSLSSASRFGSPSTPSWISFHGGLSFTTGLGASTFSQATVNFSAPNSITASDVASQVGNTVANMAPGYRAFEYAVNNFRAGNYLWSAEWGIATVGEMALAIVTVGQGNRLLAPMRTIAATETRVVAAQTEAVVTTQPFQHQAAKAAEITVMRAEITATRAGQIFEADVLAAQNLPKNTGVWRPTAAQIDSAAFKIIVGDARRTSTGLARGTIMDSVQGGFLEVKGGASVLDFTYQLRLQTYRSLVESTPYTIQTTRPVSIEFGRWLSRWGGSIQAPP